MDLEAKKHLWGIVTGQVRSLWIAHLKTRPNFWACGFTEEEAVQNLIDQIQDAKAS
jgi:hypothetical protein